MESRIERLCIDSGVKMTGQRRVVARVLSDATDHPNVEELYRRASAIDPRISIATVYRTVRLLEEKGILERRDFGEGRARYDPTDRGHHHHLIDVDTGKVIEFEDEEHEAVVKRIAARLGFTLVSQRLELFARRAPAETVSDAPRTEPARAELARAELARTEPARTEPARTEPARTEPARAEASPEPAKAEAPGGAARRPARPAPVARARRGPIPRGTGQS